MSHKYKGKHTGCLDTDECPICPKLELPGYESVRAYLTSPSPERVQCANLGKATGETVTCKTCKGNVQMKTFACAKHGICTLGINGEVAGCRGDGAGCPDFRDPTIAEPLPIKKKAVVKNRAWAFSESAKDQHSFALEAMAFMTAKPVLSGEGVLICGGGKYWPMIVVSIRMLREVSDLPVQVWHRGDKEPVRYEDVEGVPGVTIIDASQFQPQPKVLGGWEIKTFAIRNCGWRKVIYIDADAYVVNDPKPLLDLLDRDRFVFWSDLPHTRGNVKWEWFGVDPRNVPAVQGGQLAINVDTFWHELCIADWLNQSSDYSYKHAYGDQDQWRIALAATGGSYRHLGAAPWQWPAFVCRLGTI